MPPAVPVGRGQSPSGGGHRKPHIRRIRCLLKPLPLPPPRRRQGTLRRSARRSELGIGVESVGVVVGRVGAVGGQRRVAHVARDVQRLRAGIGEAGRTRGRSAGAAPRTRRPGRAHVARQNVALQQIQLIPNLRPRVGRGAVRTTACPAGAVIGRHCGPHGGFVVQPVHVQPVAMREGGVHRHAEAASARVTVAVAVVPVYEVRAQVVRARPHQRRVIFSPAGWDGVVRAAQGAVPRVGVGGGLRQPHRPLVRGARLRRAGPIGLGQGGAQAVPAIQRLVAPARPPPAQDSALVYGNATTPHEASTARHPGPCGQRSLQPFPIGGAERVLEGVAGALAAHGEQGGVVREGGVHVDARRGLVLAALHQEVPAQGLHPPRVLRPRQRAAHVILARGPLHGHRAPPRRHNLLLLLGGAASRSLREASVRTVLHQPLRINARQRAHRKPLLQLDASVRIHVELVEQSANSTCAQEGRRHRERLHRHLAHARAGVLQRRPQRRHQLGGVDVRAHALGGEQDVDENIHNLFAHLSDTVL
mmetsp:Transcript_13387/g.25704  ORF Transcript_13387/g.25704 Transcript_13387/m.25704 type:complete len:533 (-) Transcript_13387:568-2166(-)